MRSREVERVQAMSQRQALNHAREMKAMTKRKNRWMMWCIITWSCILCMSLLWAVRY